jgi:Fic family protein
MASPRKNHTLQTTILKILARHPEGLSREALQKEAGCMKEEPFQFRRRLVALEEKGLLHGEGHTRARRYFPPKSAPSQVSPGTWEHSAEGAHVLAWVDRPLDQRTPCSYERAFLDAYRPNETYYLRENDRKALHTLGVTPESQQPAGTYARKILERLLIDLSWNSSRLEGNAYSLLDTERLFKEGSSPEGKNALETQMVLNHKQAIEYLVEGAAELSLTPGTLRTLHGMLAENLLSDPRDEGRLRDTPVGIYESTYIPLAVPMLIQEIFEQMLLNARAILDPFEQAFFLLVHLPYLQPFSDVNKRCSRLAANLPLLKHNLQPLSFVDTPRETYTLATLAVYETQRIEALRDVFLWAYRRSAERYRALRQSMGEPDPFRLRYRNALREMVRTLVQEADSELPIQARIQAYAETFVPAADRSRFQAVALQELRNIHEGTYARYGLRPSEFERWKGIQALDDRP